MKKLNIIKRIIYAAVGMAGLWAAWFMITEWTKFWTTMPGASPWGYIILMIGGINWGWVAITNDPEIDLLGFFGLK